MLWTGSAQAVFLNIQQSSFKLPLFEFRSNYLTKLLHEYKWHICIVHSTSFEMWYFSSKVIPCDDTLFRLKVDPFFWNFILVNIQVLICFSIFLQTLSPSIKFLTPSKHSNLGSIAKCIPCTVCSSWPKGLPCLANF